MQMTKAPPLWRQAEEVGVAQPGEWKVVWEPQSSLPESEGGLQGDQRGLLNKRCKWQDKGKWLQIEREYF